MNKNITKRFSLVLSIFVIGTLLVGCGSKKQTTSDLLKNSSKDSKVNIALVTDGKDEEGSLYDVAKTEVMQFDYRKKNDDDFNGRFEHIVLPEQGGDNQLKIKKIFEGIKKNKDINVLVVSSKNKNLLNYIDDIKKQRKDILTISSDMENKPIELSKTFDLNFGVSNIDRGKRIVQLSKSMGAEKVICFASDNDLKNEANKKIYEQFLEESKKDDIDVILQKIPSELTTYEKKAFVSNKIDDIINEYGNNIDIYSFDGDLDEVLATKMLKDKFYIAEFSNRNINKKLLEIYGITQIPRQMYNYVFENPQIGNIIESKYNIKRRMSSYGAEPKNFALEFSIELGYTMKSKNIPIKKAYNSYFLEKVSFAKLGIESGFLNIKNNIGNYKIVDPDQIMY